MNWNLEKAKEFCKGLEISRGYGFSDYIVFTHAYHESGGFNRVIGKHNYWGIKKPKNWKGDFVIVITHEYINEDEKIKIEDKFIDFKTIEEAMDWYCNFIKRLYPNAYNNRDNPEGYFNGLVNGKLKYATDPKYAEKLIKLYYFLASKDEVRSLLKREIV